VETSGNRLWKLVEYRLVPCSTETGELELENWVGIPRSLNKEWQEDFLVIRSDSFCVEILCQETTNGD
jgi:hypothetical protein